MDSASSLSFTAWYEKTDFEAHQNLMINPKKHYDLSYYSIVYVITNNATGEIYLNNETQNSLGVFVYTALPKQANSKFNFAEYTIGELSQRLSRNTKPTFIKVNSPSIEDGVINPCEEIIYCPLMDKMSQQLTITSLDQTLPLMAIDSKKVQTMNFEAIYGFFRDAELPKDRGERTQHIFKMIEFIKFATKRTPIKFGSSSIICIFLDFDDPIEENQFIQDYELFDNYSNVIFVNSQLEIINSYRQKIAYDGDKMETILLPIINWQKSNNIVRQELL